MTNPSNSTLIQSTFGPHATALDVVDGVNLRGKRAIVTGSSSGIGIETARALASAGAEVTLAVRDINAGTDTARDIVTSTGNPLVRVARLDLMDPDSISDFIGNWSDPLHILINNAGIIAPDRQLASTGWESTLASNFLGHFALSIGLHGALAAASGARIVSLTSQAHMRSPVVFDDVQFAVRPHEPTLAYGQSRTAQILFAVEAFRRWASDSITANAVDPGAIAATGLTRHMDVAVRTTVQSLANFSVKTREEGAATTVFVATSPQFEGIGGRYFEDCNEMPVLDTGERLLSAGDPLPNHAVAAYAVDPGNAERLWELALGAFEDWIHASDQTSHRVR
jgi:NAD(P)-dependent dehydrogenase (short-subunit alcohol dehydrogenase family)